MSKLDNIVKIEKVKFDMDIGKRNLGFKYTEAIMESIDDSFDAFFRANGRDLGCRIDIYFYEEDYEEIYNDNVLISKRYSYTILDNGPGTSVDNIFNFGKVKEQRFSDVEYLNSLNGLFHYGMSSHMNVGNQLFFFSREKESQWWLNCIESNDISDDILTYKKEQMPDNVINNIPINLNDPDFYVSTVVQVKGIRKSEVEVDIENKIQEILLKQFGITYKHYIERGNTIYINGIKVKAIDPFLIEHEYTEKDIESSSIHSFEIKLSELLEREDQIVKQRIHKRFSHLFVDERELLEQSIEINMFHLNVKFIKSIFKKQIAKELPNILLPSPEYSGFYIKRNLRYIGRAAKILDICTDHPSFNYFRAEISFSPIFDEFFGIQVNKNKYDIKNSLASLITKKINAKTKVKLSTFLDQYKKKKLKETPVSIKSQLTLKVRSINQVKLHLESVRTDAQEIGVNHKLINETYEIVVGLEDINKSLSLALENYKENLELNEKDVKFFEEKVIALIQDADEVLGDSEQMLARLENAISLRNGELIYPAKILKERVNKAVNSRRLLVTKDSDQISEFQGFIVEPLNEVQMYGLLYQMLHYYPDVFGFVLLDYSENKSLDCVVKIKQLELFQDLNIKHRFENQWNQDWDEYLSNYEGAFSFVELKYLLGEKEDLGHSMSLVSHLICWDFHPNNINEFSATDGKYRLSKDRNYLFHQNKMKKVKVLSLKALLEELMDEEFITSKDEFYNFL